MWVGREGGNTVVCGGVSQSDVCYDSPCPSGESGGGLLLVDGVELNGSADSLFCRRCSIRRCFRVCWLSLEP